jgi:hypothetical protein
MKITIPIRGSDFESAYTSYELFLSEIIRLSNNPKLISLIDDKVISDKNEIPRIIDIVFKIVEGNIQDNTEPEFATRLNQKHSFFHPEWISEYLIIDLTIKDEDELGDYNRFLINSYLTRLNLLINLSYSTNVDFLPGVIYSNTDEYIGETEIIISSIMNAYEHSTKIKWPVIKNLTLMDTVNWFHKFDIHPNNRSRNNVHRAINAFSQLFGNLKSKNSADLFWIMLGIESLLAEGSQSISYQIKEKSIIILGKPTEYTKKLGKLYDYRSRLIHGDIDIFPKFYTDYESFDIEYGDYLDFAVSILIALIRELIEKQKSEFEFELKLK